MLKAYVFMFLGLIGIFYTLSCFLNMLYIKALKKDISKFDIVKTVVMVFATIFLLSNIDINPTGDFGGPTSLIFLLLLGGGVIGVLALFDARINSSEKTINKKSHE